MHRAQRSGFVLVIVIDVKKPEADPSRTSALPPSPPPPLAPASGRRGAKHLWGLATSEFSVLGNVLLKTGDRLCVVGLMQRRKDAKMMDASCSAKRVRARYRYRCEKTGGRPRANQCSPTLIPPAPCSRQREKGSQALVGVST
jgi:hypothetical protein